MEIEFYTDADDKHRWRVRAANGEIVGASSEAFHTLAGCEANAELLGQALGLYSLQKVHGEIEVKGI